MRLVGAELYFTTHELSWEEKSNERFKSKRKMESVGLKDVTSPRTACYIMQGKLRAGSIAT